MYRYDTYDHALVAEPVGAELIEPDASLEQRHGNAIRKAELPAIRRRRVRILHDVVAGTIRREIDATDVAQYVGRRPATSISDLERDVNRRMRVGATRVQLVAVLGDLPPLAKAVGDACRIVQLRHRREEATLPLEDPRRTSEPESCEIRREDAVERRLARVEVLAHRAVGIELPQPRGLRSGGAERVEHLRRR